MGGGVFRTHFELRLLEASNLNLVGVEVFGQRLGAAQEAITVPL